MAREISPNKLNKRDKRQIENVRERLRAEGVGEDEATKMAVDEVTRQEHSGRGGGRNSGAERQKRTIHGGRGRTGSQKQRKG
jgi:hypothetical protein